MQTINTPLPENVKKLLKDVRTCLKYTHAAAEAIHDNPDDEQYMSYTMYTVMQDTDRLLTEINLIVGE